MSKTMVLRPRISEKAYGLAQTNNVYVFQVPVDAGKLEVASAVTAQFDVHVIGVNIMNVVGKPKRTVRRGGRPTNGKRADFKKAYVTIKAGDIIPVFASEDEQATEKPAATKKGKK